MQVRVVPRDADNVFVHGKAGVIQHADGRTYSFVAANELGRRMIQTAGACFGIRCRLPPSMPCSATFATTGGWRPERY
jgi:hypothetical protein